MRQLATVVGVANPETTVEANLTIVDEAIAQRVATRVSGTVTTTVGPPTAGTWVLKDFWRDANGAEYRCTVAGTSGTWLQITEPVLTATPGGCPTGYRWVRSDLNGQRFYWDGSNALALTTEQLVFETGTVGGSAIATGIKGYLRVPFACRIVKVTVLLEQSGSIVWDVWKDTFANYPPTVADTITASAKPTVTTATKSEDSTLTGWTRSISAGEVLGFKVDSITTAAWSALQIEVQRT